jgi:hypothetical protein
MFRLIQAFRSVFAPDLGRPVSPATATGPATPELVDDGDVLIGRRGAVPIYLGGVGGMGRWPRLGDQPEHSAGVRPTEGNIPAHLSHRPERTAQHLLLLQPWSTAAHEPGVPRPSDLLTSLGKRSPGSPITIFRITASARRP